MRNPYHNEVVRGPLTRNVGTKFAEIHEEIQEAFGDELSSSLGAWIQPFLVKCSPRVEWTSVIVSPMIRRVVARASNRLFVGLPLCALFYSPWNRI